MGNKTRYRIGAKYRYPDQRRFFKLKDVKKNILGDPIVFYFECGHWCTDLIFIDLIESGKKYQVKDDNQLSLWKE